MRQTFIRVGNSRALTVPARIIKQSGFDDNTTFEFEHRGSSFIFKATPLFPKIKLSEHLSERMQNLIDSQVRYTKEEIENDPRLKAIIER